MFEGMIPCPKCKNRCAAKLTECPFCGSSLENTDANRSRAALLAANEGPTSALAASSQGEDTGSARRSSHAPAASQALSTAAPVHERPAQAVERAGPPSVTGGASLTLCPKCKLPYNAKKTSVCPNCGGEGRGVIAEVAKKDEEIAEAATETIEGEKLFGNAIVGLVVLGLGLGITSLAFPTLGASYGRLAAAFFGCVLAAPIAFIFHGRYSRKAAAQMQTGGGTMGSAAVMQMGVQFGCLGALLAWPLRMLLATRLGFALGIWFISGFALFGVLAGAHAIVNGAALGGDPAPISCMVVDSTEPAGKTVNLTYECMPPQGNMVEGHTRYESTSRVPIGTTFEHPSRMGRLGEWVPEHARPVIEMPKGHGAAGASSSAHGDVSVTPTKH